MSHNQESEDYDVQLDESLSNILVVDGLPIIGMEKFNKLQAHIRKTYSAFGPITEFYMPIEANATNPKQNVTSGYAFIEFESADDARRVVTEAGIIKLDSKHDMRATLLDDYEKMTSVTEDYTPPKLSDFATKTNLNGWLLDELSRDQFVMRFGHETQIFWSDPLRRANEQGRALQYANEKARREGKTWTDSYVSWSPRGSYLATFHQQGLLLWGGDDFARIGRFMHPNVKYIDFSPCEKYLVTSNGEDAVKPGDPECIIVWDIRAGKKLRGFNRGVAASWPAFKWSHDDTYFARIALDEKALAMEQERLKTTLDAAQSEKFKQISIYEAASCALLDKKSVKIPGVADMAWSPSEHLISFAVPGINNAAARVALMQIPSRKIVREKHIYNVADIKMHWQSEGDFLCVKMSRKKTKTKSTTNFEIFRVHQKDIPIEAKEIEDNIQAFAWEPHGNRFAIIHGDGARPNVSFYQLKPKELKLLGTLPQRAANTLFWSPRGQYIVLAGLGALNGVLEFVDVNNMDSLATTEHFMCTDVEWDASGRHVITAVTQPINHNADSYKYANENGYRVYNVLGQQLVSVNQLQLYQVLWRPRPPTTLPKQKIQEIRDNLKDKYWRQFESEDDRLMAASATGAAKERQQMKADWKAYRAERDKEYAEEASLRADLRGDLRGGFESDDEDDYITIEKEVEVEIERTIEEL